MKIRVKLKFLVLILLPLSGYALDPGSVREEVSARWNAFQNNQTFIPFERGKSDEILIKEFDNLEAIRTVVWTLPGYERAEILIQNDHVRAPRCAAFRYNNTAPYYNASTIVLGDRIAIACQGPRTKDVPNFFKLLVSQGVTHLVRLTDSHEGAIEKCHPYWEGLESSSNGKTYLNIPAEKGVYTIRAYDLAEWKDFQAIDPEKLLALVLQVRKELKDGLLAVHCSAGVGRTGTFLAALAIVDAIDRGGAFSIEEIVYHLSLQRIFACGTSPMYITLHRLAEKYLKELHPF